MSLTQYLESQEDQDMIRLHHFTRTQEKRREGGLFFNVLWNEGEGGLYSSGGENMNGRSFNEGWQKIMNLDLILALGKSGALNGMIGGSKPSSVFL